MDNFSIWNRILSSSEIDGLYNGGAGKAIWNLPQDSLAPAGYGGVGGLGLGGGGGGAGSGEFVFGLFTSANDVKGKSTMGSASAGPGSGPGGSYNIPNQGISKGYITIGGGYTYSPIGVQAYGGPMDTKITYRAGFGRDRSTTCYVGSVKTENGNLNILPVIITNDNGKKVTIFMSEGVRNVYLRATGQDKSTSKNEKVKSSKSRWMV